MMDRQNRNPISKPCTIHYDHRFADYGVSSAFFAREAAYSAFCEDNDPDYDAEDAEYDETTPANRVEHVATFSLLAVYDVSGPLEESRHCERLALAVTLSDFNLLMDRKSSVQLTEFGPLWNLDFMETYSDKLKKHIALVTATLP